jgi:ribonuclease VapC
MEATATLLAGARVDVVSFDSRHAADTAKLFGETKDTGLSFADRACLSLAIDLGAALYTADKRLAGVKAPIEVVLIREPVAAGAKKRK